MQVSLVRIVGSSIHNCWYFVQVFIEELIYTFQYSTILVELLLLSQTGIKTVAALTQNIEHYIDLLVMAQLSLNFGTKCQSSVLEMTARGACS